MKVGDFVGWSDIEGDGKPTVPAGIILDIEQHSAMGEFDNNYNVYLVLLQHNGGLSWEHGSDLVVMYESR